MRIQPNTKVPGEPQIVNEQFWRSLSFKPWCFVVAIMPSLIIIVISIFKLRNPVPPVQKYINNLIIGYANYNYSWHERRVFRVRHYRNNIAKILNNSPVADSCVGLIDQIVEMAEKDAEQARQEAIKESQTLPWQR